MSRIGRLPIPVPAGVTVTVGEDNLITVKGAKGTLSYQAAPILTVKVDGPVVTVTRPDDENETRSLHGLTRTLINNMVVGVSEGYSKKLVVNGVGWKVQNQGKDLLMNIIDNFMKNLTVDKVNDFAHKKNINLSNEELKFVGKQKMIDYLNQKHNPLLRYMPNP